MQIYAVTSGTYSDYGIEKVFLSREKALAFIKTRESQEAWEDFRIEVYEPYDEDIETTDGYLDDVYINLTVYYEIENDGHWYVGAFCQYVCYQYKNPDIQEFRDWRHDGKLIKAEIHLTVKPQLTDDKIIKIAQDEYAKWKAEKEEVWHE